MDILSGSKVWRYLLMSALAPVIWGTTYIVTTQWLPADRPYSAAMLRCLPAGIVLIILARHLPVAREWFRLLVLAALNIAVFQALLFVAAYRLPGGIAAVMAAVQPLIVMALIWGIDGRKPGWVAAGASMTAVAGMALLLLTPAVAWDAIGVVAALVSACSMALGTWLAQRWRTTMPLLAFTGWQLLLGGLMLLPIAWAFDAPLPVLSAAQITAYVYLASFGTLLAYLLWFNGIAKLSPVAVSSLSLLSPLTAALIGWIALGQSLSAVPLTGFIIVLLSVLAVQIALQSPNTLLYMRRKYTCRVR